MRCRSAATTNDRYPDADAEWPSQRHFWPCHVSRRRTRGNECRDAGRVGSHMLGSASSFASLVRASDSTPNTVLLRDRLDLHLSRIYDFPRCLLIPCLQLRCDLATMLSPRWTESRLAASRRCFLLAQIMLDPGWRRPAVVFCSRRLCSIQGGDVPSLFSARAGQRPINTRPTTADNHAMHRSGGGRPSFELASRSPPPGDRNRYRTDPSDVPRVCLHKRLLQRLVLGASFGCCVSDSPIQTP
ncbi:hypothetical protein Poly51_59510 [Rubripirellula tenax]|uniref:Uncharacterized protein n=1 Tax=Rubripirellula tenax TaxID=2528015 RepID=A0A5C6E6V8_9BACT|nr:hypothetical protein Poly51_59510 [Rubripirellula tenax]